MSTQAKQLNDVPTVDIGPSTRILALDSSGAVGKGTLAETVGRCGNIVDFPNAEQGDWWRIANIDFCGVGIICIRELWTQSSPRPVVLGVALDAYPGGNSTNNNGIKVLAGESNRISKIRFVVDVPNKANDGWLDICIPHTDKYKSRRTQIASYGLGIRPVELAEAPSVDNAHFVKEFDMTTLQSNSGGVISCTAIGPYLVAYKEKGGPHEHCGKNSDFGLHQTIGAGHDSEQGIYHRLQHLYDGWSIFVHNRGRSWTATKCEPLWDTAGGDILPIRGTVIPQSRGEGIHKVIHCDRSDRPRVFNLDYTVDLTPRKEVVAA